MRKLFVPIVFVLSANVFAETTYGDIPSFTLKSVYDGDTFTIDIPQYADIVGKNIDIRVNGVNAPEIRGKCQNEIELAYKAKEFTSNKLNTSKTVAIKNISRDKYFRIDGDVIVDGENLADLLIKNNLGYPYHGKTKQGWCK